MLKQIFFLLCLAFASQSYTQKLVYKSNGTILNSDNQKMFPDQVRELLKSNEKLLAEYNSGRTKKTVGNILLITGPVLMFGDLVLAVFNHKPISEENPLDKEINYPSALSFIGLAATLIAIPVKIGFSKKIKNVVKEFNNQAVTGYNDPKIDFIGNSNGIGFRLTLN